MTAIRLLLLGRRQGALAAAARLQAEVFLLDDVHSTRPKRRFARVDFAHPAGCAEAARRLLGDRPPDAVVALVERAVMPAAAIREALGVHGADRGTARRWRDKLEMKARIREAGLPCAETRAIENDTRAHALIAELGLPMVIKPRSASGGRGRVIAHDEREVRAALSVGAIASSERSEAERVVAINRGVWGGSPPRMIAERFVHGPEVSVESLVQDGQVIFENITEYLRPGWANVVPAALPPEIDEAVRRLNRAALDALEVENGITHLEAFIEEGTIVFGEVACRPAGGSLMELIERVYGFDPWRAHLEIELGRTPEVRGIAERTAGVFFLHPGEGRVRSVEGLERARAIPGVAAIECNLQAGQWIGRREGTGQYKGRVIAVTSSRERTVAALEAAHSTLRLTMQSRDARDDHSRIESPPSIVSTDPVTHSASRR